MLKPLGDRVIVKILDAEEKTAGGIVLPDTAKEKPTQGLVVSAGPGRLMDNGKLSPMEVKEGDKVLFSKYGGTEVKVDGQEFTILRQDDVLGILQ